jgi:mRNA-degrading endonuclease YafQ of YafQ-DinJ toxin-antitoxin module
LLAEEAQCKRLDEEYKKKLFSVAATREASKTELKLKEARLIELQIKQTKIANIFAELKKAEKVDMCFMLDATGSMSSYISEAKSVIHRIIDKLKNRFQDFELRAAFVGYRDHADGPKRVTVFDFDQNIDSFKTFVSSVEATGGQDQCEDVFGGLEVIKLRENISCAFN